MSGIDQKLDSHKEMIAKVAEDVAVIRTQSGDHELRITELENR